MMRFLSNKERRELLKKFPWLKGKNIAIDDSVVYVNGIARALLLGGRAIPTLKSIIEGDVSLPKVVVDMGAVRFVVNGADIMGPGVVSVEEFEEGAVVVVVDETHGKPLAVGVALLPSEEIAKKPKGKVVKNLHWVGDKVWERAKS